MVLSHSAHVFLAYSWLAAAYPAEPAPEGVKAPNIILILADDLGWSDLACYGNDFHETPHLDKLARQGTRFTNAYSASPVCSPTRASLLTGKHPARLGITIWREGALNPPKNRKLLPAPALADLPHTETTVATTLRAGGYLTALVGKWHLGDADHSPETHGFDVNIGGTHWGAPATFFFPYRGLFDKAGERRYVPHLELGKSGEYLTDRLTDEAIRVITHAGDNPFFLFLAHHAPHTPIEAKPEIAKRYAEKARSQSRRHNPAYAGMIQSLDECVGRILELLEKTGQARRTVLIFTSDNGGQIGTYAGATVTSNSPLRSGKGSLYEGGVRVPLVIRWPGMTKAGTVCHEPVVSTDMYRTILEMSGVKTGQPVGACQDGSSLVSLLVDPKKSLGRGSLYWHYPHYYSTTTPASAIREGDWKLLDYMEDGRQELYNLSTDQGEIRDLAGTLPERKSEMLGRLQSWRNAVKARMPAPNPG